MNGVKWGRHNSARNIQQRLSRPYPDRGPGTGTGGTMDTAGISLFYLSFSNSPEASELEKEAYNYN